MAEFNEEEFNARVEREARLHEAEEIELFSRKPKSPPMTEKEFDGIKESSAARFEKAKSENKTGYCGVWDFYVMDMMDAARAVNPVEWYRVWHGNYPKYYSSWGHTLKYMHQAHYYINKALACGIAETAAEAVQYFNDNK